MFFTSKFKQDVAQTFREQDVWIQNLERRIEKLEADAIRNGYHKEHGVPKRKPGRPRKETAQ